MSEKERMRKNDEVKIRKKENHSHKMLFKIRCAYVDIWVFLITL